MQARMGPQSTLQQSLCRLPLTLLAHLSLTLLLSQLSLFPIYVASLILNSSTFLQVAFFSSFMLIFFFYVIR